MSEPGGGRRPGGGVCRARSSGRRKGRKNKVRATPFPIRLHHHHQRSAENAASGGPVEVQPARAAQYRQLRREGLMTKVKTEKKTVKSEKNSTTTTHSPSVHRCEQWNLHKQKNKLNVQHTKTNSPRKTERLQTDSELANSAVQKTEKKPLTSTENVQNMKSKKDICTSDEKGINYAGAKFSDPPSPSVLPKPPSHWMDMTIQHSNQCKELMTYHLKTLLKVQL
ncbi:PREDICTED: proline-rich nuclear receptor coactivator 1 [Nanorana parkeri]|uniref:proline-rich nuclear receptor coactivator 1 n=1 Tax=Nanorana parkeri TaxID=125878 RepID=UPI0008549A19|nr:PREDICTED: proline-rich nuclear receptor coactivator 1 [Nanorana parkeri]